MQQSIPASTGDNSMDSDEKQKLVNEVEELQTQLTRAGAPVDPELAKFFYRRLEGKSPAERFSNWKLY